VDAELTAQSVPEQHAPGMAAEAAAGVAGGVGFGGDGVGMPPPQGSADAGRMPKRYWVGALLSVVVGAAIAAVSISTTSGSDQPVKPLGVLASPQARTQSQAKGAAVQALWRTKPAEQLFPSTVTSGSQYLRLGVADAAGCDVLPKDFTAELSKVAPGTSCVKVLRATYTDVTQTVFATVGIVVIDGDVAARDKVWRQWTPDSDSRRPELMPDVVPVSSTVAAGFADSQRVAWNSQAADDGAYLVYVVSGFADGRAGTTDAQLRAGSGKALAADSPPVQTVLGLSQVFIAQFNSAGKDQ